MMAEENSKETQGEPQDYPEQNTDNQGGQAAAGQGEQEETASIPVSVVQKMRQELKEAKDRANHAEQQAKETGQYQQSQQPTQSAGGDDDPLANMEDDDLLDAKTARKIVQKQTQQNKQALSEMQTRMKFPDYEDVINNHLPNLIEQKPYLRDAIMSSQNPYVLAYELGKGAKGDQAKQGQQSQQGTLEQQLDKYAQTPGSPSSTGSQGGPTSGADYYSNLTMEKLDEEIAKAKRGQ